MRRALLPGGFGAHRRERERDVRRVRQDDRRTRRIGCASRRPRFREEKSSSLMKHEGSASAFVKTCVVCFQERSISRPLGPAFRWADARPARLLAQHALRQQTPAPHNRRSGGYYISAGRSARQHSLRSRTPIHSSTLPPAPISNLHELL